MFDLDWYRVLVYTFILSFCFFVWVAGFKLGGKVINMIFGG
jgi:hypothetical protein